MIRHPYRAGAVKVAFWFSEFRKMVELLEAGRTFDEIRRMAIEENVFGASTVTRRRQVFSTVSARVRSLDSSFRPVFLQGALAEQKQFALAAALAHDTLFFEIFHGVIHEKMMLGVFSCTSIDIRIFLEGIQSRDERASHWTAATIQRLVRSYLAMLTEAGILAPRMSMRGARADDERTIEPPILDENVRNWLLAHDMPEIVCAFSDH